MPAMLIWPFILQAVLAQTPSHAYDVQSYSTSATCIALDSPAINRAIEAAAANGVAP